MTPPKAAARQVDPAPPQWPKLLYNVNLPPKLAYSLDQVAELGAAWRTQDLNPWFPEVPGVDIDPAEATFPATGGPGSVDVRITSAGQSGAWTVTRDGSATWITIVAPEEPQMADGQVLYTVAINSGAERTANLYINGKTHAVTQEGTA